jgi:hypothetical protein
MSIEGAKLVIFSRSRQNTKNCVTFFVLFCLHFIEMDSGCQNWHNRRNRVNRHGSPNHKKLFCQHEVTKWRIDG